MSAKHRIDPTFCRPVRWSQTGDDHARAITRAELPQNTVQPSGRGLHHRLIAILPADVRRTGRRLSPCLRSASPRAKPKPP